MASRTLQCAICLDDINDPRILPCIHSFCLGCLEQYCRDKLPGDEVPCPECRSGFVIPKNGVAGTLSNEPAIRASWHRRGGGYCEEHEDKRIKMYCFECDMNVCSMCCLESHKTHKYERIETAAEQFSTSIDDEIEQVTSRIECYRGASAQVEAENYKMLDNIKSIKLEVKKRSEDLVEKLKQLADRQAKDVLQELQSLKSAAEEEVNSHTETLRLALAEMESLRTSLEELRSKGSPSDMTQAANGMLVVAQELLQTYVSPSEYRSPSYNFTSVNIDELLSDDQNFIGHVDKVNDSGNVMICC